MWTVDCQWYHICGHGGPGEMCKKACTTGVVQRVGWIGLLVVIQVDCKNKFYKRGYKSDTIFLNIRVVGTGCTEGFILCIIDFLHF